MKISLEWLSNYVDLGDRTPEDIENALTMIGFEVEGIENTGLASMPRLVVGKVMEKTPHPDADRLNVCQVEVGADTLSQIVCGATNYKVGDCVPVALPKCVLPGDFKIKKSKLRGVKSEGMMCSARELGMGNDHAGLMILEGDPTPGTLINDLFTESDTVFDIEVTPNRPDCLSHVGIARELAAFFQLGMDYPEVKTSVVKHDVAEKHLVENIDVSVEDLCPHYQGWSIRGVKIAPSPEWLQKQLTAVGLRPINNVVDITNYVLHELGQPLHAFDADKIAGKQINIRLAHKGEKIVTLDDKERELEDYMLVIADAEKPLVIAGVMGSIAAEVDETTTDIFLEAAYFNPSRVRRTSRRLALSTDSSYRFERGVDPKGAEFAAMRTIDLILELAGGELVGAPLIAGSAPIIEQEITITGDYVRKSFGFDISDKEIVRVLESLELVVHEYINDEGIAAFTVGIPSFRLDLQRPADLIEECLRIYGTDKIPSVPVAINSHIHEDSGMAQFQTKTARLLVGRGFNECVHYPMRSEEEIRQWYGHTQADNLALANPLASDQSHLRTSVLPGLLDAVKLNLSRYNQPQRLFEIGRAFREHDGKVWEVLYVGFVMVQANESSWKQRELPDFYSVARVVSSILKLGGVQVEPAQFESITKDNPWQEGHAAKVGGFEKGWEAKFGMLNMSLVQEKDIEDCVYAGGIYFLPEFLEKEIDKGSYSPISLFPPATRDLALIVKEDVPAGQIQSELMTFAKKCTQGAFDVESVKIFDVYQGKGIDDGCKSLAFSIQFRSLDRTLKDDEVNRAFEELQVRIKDKTDYQIRS